MITPNAACAAFCYWLLNVSWQHLSGSQRALVQLVSAASIAQSPITSQQWSNFNKFTAWRYPFYKVYSSLATQSSRPLDIWPNATLAFSFRRLNSAYNGPCVTVRRSSDDALMAIGFVNEFLDISTLLTFAAGSSCSVSEWWDQSGNSNNAVQSTYVDQPLLVVAGTLVTTNTLPAIQWDGARTFLDLTMSINPAADYAGWQVSKKDALGSLGTVLAGYGVTTPPYVIFPYTDDNIYSANIVQYLKSTLPVDTANQNIYYAGTNGVTNQMFLNSVAVPFSVIPFVRTTTLDTIGQFPVSGEHSTGTVQELVLYLTDQTAHALPQSNNAKSAFLIP